MRRLLSSLVVLGTAVGCSSAPTVPDAAPTETAAQATLSAESWRNDQPQAGDSPELVLPKFESTTLPNGLTVLNSHRADLPLVSLSITCVAGSAQDPKGKAGLANASYRMLLEGAGTRDALAFDDAFADLGVSPGVGVGADSGAVSATVLTRNADAALGLLADAVTRPRLQKADFERRKGQLLADQARMAGEPRFAANWAMAETVFGPASPYGHLTTGTAATLKTLTLADVKRYITTNLGPRACALVATGDVTLADAKALAEKHLGAWKSAAVRPPAPPMVEASARKDITFVPKAGLAQTLIYLARPGLVAGDPREPELDLATSIFGGFFGSRLNMNLREAKGYTYGAFAAASSRRGPGSLYAGSSVRADVTGPALKEMISELNGMKSNPITAAELAEAREGLIRSLPGDFSNLRSLAGTAANLFATAQPLDSLQTWVGAVESADAAAVQQTAEAFLKPELLQIIMVGDPEIVNAQVPELGLGPIRTLELPK